MNAEVFGNRLLKPLLHTVTRLHYVITAKPGKHMYIMTVLKGNYESRLLYTCATITTTNCKLTFSIAMKIMSRCQALGTAYSEDILSLRRLIYHLFLLPSTYVVTGGSGVIVKDVDSPHLASWIRFPLRTKNIIWLPDSHSPLSMRRQTNE